MKVKALSRSRQSTTHATPYDLRPLHKNLNPASYPLPRAHEYTQALTAAKLDRMFVNPFVGELKGSHVNGVNCISVSRHNLLLVVSGSVDGTVRTWDLQSRTMVKNLEAHGRCVSGLVFGNGVEGIFYSCGEEGLVKAWSCYPRKNGGYEKEKSDDEDSQGHAKKPVAKKLCGHKSYKLNSGSSNGEESPDGPINTYRLSVAWLIMPMSSLKTRTRDRQVLTLAPAPVQTSLPTLKFGRN